MLGLRTQTAFALIVLTIVLASVVVIPANAATYSFELKAEGQAYDYRARVWRSVKISLTGTGYGSLTWWMSLRVISGTVTVDGQTYRIIGGWGILIQRYHYISLYIRITPPYGGPIAGWFMYGRTGVYYANTIPISLSSRYIILPTYPRYTILYNLMLTGEITLK
jgi:hypothetical protein